MIGTLIIIVVVVAVLGLVAGGIALTRSRRRAGRRDDRTPDRTPDRTAVTTAAGVCAHGGRADADAARCAARSRTPRGRTPRGPRYPPKWPGRPHTGAASVASADCSAGRSPRCVPAASTPPPGSPWKRLSSAPTSGSPRRRRSSTSSGPRCRASRSPAVTTCCRRSARPSGRCSTVPGRGSCTSTAEPGNPTSGCSSESTESARRRLSASWPVGSPTPAAPCSWLRATRSGPPPPINSPCGRSEPAPRSSVGPRAPTPVRSCSTPCSVPRREATTWCSPTRPGACTRR